MKIETHSTHFGPQYHSNIYLSTDSILDILTGNSTKFVVTDKLNCIATIAFYANTYIVIRVKHIAVPPVMITSDGQLKIAETYFTIHFCHLDLLKYLWDTFDSDKMRSAVKWYMKKNKHCMDQYHYSYYPHRELSAEVKTWFMSLMLGTHNE